MNYLQKKKLAFMSIVNSVKGFVRTITGVFPLTLEGCVDDESIIDYTLYGQSVQNGTPTPETPVEVESVGEKTTNLINWDLLLGNATYPITKVDNGYYSTKYFNAFDKSSNLVKQIKSVLKPNTTYTLSRRYSGTRDSANGSIMIQNSASENIVQCRYGEGLVKVTFTLTQEQIDSIDHLYIYFHNNGGTITNLQLTESGTVLPYEPYGYKIPITVSGKNLFDINTVISATDSWYYSAGSYSYGLGLEAGKQYRFFCDVVNNPGTISVAICRKPKISLWKFTTLYDIMAKSPLTTGKKSYTFVADGTECLWLYKDGGGKLDIYKEYIIENIKNFQIEEGTTATDYEPYHDPITTNIYLDEPLRKVGDYADYIKSVDLVNGTGTVARCVYECNMTEVFNTLNIKAVIYGKYTSVIRFSHNLNTMKCRHGKASCKTISNRFISANANSFNVDRECVFFHNTLTTHFYTSLQKDRLGIGETDTDSEILNKHAEYVKNNDTKVYYALATPTEIPITLPNLPTFKGASIISTDTTVQPSNAEVTYYSNVKE